MFEALFHIVSIPKPTLPKTSCYKATEEHLLHLQRWGPGGAPTLRPMPVISTSCKPWGISTWVSIGVQCIAMHHLDMDSNMINDADIRKRGWGHCNWPVFQFHENMQKTHSMLRFLEVSTVKCRQIMQNHASFRSESLGPSQTVLESPDQDAKLGLHDRDRSRIWGVESVWKVWNQSVWSREVLSAEIHRNPSPNLPWCQHPEPFSPQCTKLSGPWSSQFGERCCISKTCTAAQFKVCPVSTENKPERNILEENLLMCRDCAVLSWSDTMVQVLIPWTHHAEIIAWRVSSWPPQHQACVHSYFHSNIVLKDARINTTTHQQTQQHPNPNKSQQVWRYQHISAPRFRLVPTRSDTVTVSPWTPEDVKSPRPM